MEKHLIFSKAVGVILQDIKRAKCGITYKSKWYTELETCLRELEIKSRKGEVISSDKFYDLANRIAKAIKGIIL